MIDKDRITKGITKTEDKLLVAKVLDKATRAARFKEVFCSDFLDPHQAKLVEKALLSLKELNYSFYGGYPGAERVIAIFRPDFISETRYMETLPLKTVNITLSRRENLTHRDYLGAVMGLGIRREKIGDILVRQEGCSIIVFSEIGEYLNHNLTKVADVGVDVNVSDISVMEAVQPKVKEISTTVASLRLDTVASSGFGMSRSKMTEFIKAEKVSLNWEITSSPTKQVKAGDTISMRGRGRVVVDSIGGPTRKGRITILLKKLI